MPWPKKYVMGCCLFCKQPYQIYVSWQGFKWCICPGASAAKKLQKNAHNQEWYRKRQEAKGLEVLTRSERAKRNGNRPNKYRNRREYFGLRIRGELHPCRLCGTLTINRWNCPTCLNRLGDAFDLTIAIEPGYTRRLGTRAH
jgi:hypothetical protein